MIAMSKNQLCLNAVATALVLCALTLPVGATSAQVLLEQASPLAHKGQYDQAEPLYRRALALLTKAPSADQSNLKECFSWLGYISESKNKLSDAEQYFKHALEVQEKLSAGHHDPYEEILAMALDDLAQIYTKEGKYAAARALELRSLEMRKHTYGADSQDYRQVLERLSEIDKHLGNKTSVTGLTKQILDIKVKEYGPVLGPFYACAQKRTHNNQVDCVVPLLTVVGVGSNFSEWMAASELNKLFGKVSPWYKIPNWLAGLWQGSYTLPTGRTIEIDGELYDDPPAFSGPGAYAKRRGAVATVDGWWERLDTRNTDYWCWCDLNGPGAAKVMEPGKSLQPNKKTPHIQGPKRSEYSYWHRHTPITTSDGMVLCRESTITYALKEVPANLPLLPASKKVTAIWQIDRVDVFGKVGYDKKTGKDQVALYSATIIYDGYGKPVNQSPGEGHHTAYDGVLMQNRIGEPAPIKFQGFDARSSLVEFLTRERKLDELKKLR